MFIQQAAFWLSLLMIFLMPLEGVLTIPGVGTASRLCGVAAAGLWLCAVLVKGQLRKLTSFHVLVLVFFLWNLLSVFWTTDPDSTLSRIVTYAQVAVLTILLWDLFTTRAAIYLGLQAYVLGAWPVIFFTAANYLSGNQISYGRYASVGSIANNTGIILTLGVPLAWHLAMVNRRDGLLRRLLWLLNLLFLPAAAFAMALTGSRFAVLITVPVLLFGIISLTRIGLLSRIAILLVVVAGGLSAAAALLPETTIERLATVDEELASGDLNGRTVFWERGLQLWGDSPLLGIGTGAFDEAMTPYYGRPRSAHSSFVAVLTELGAVGILLFGAIIAKALLLAWHHPVREEARFWLTVLFVWLAANSVLTWIDNKPSWLLLILLVATAYVQRQHPAAQRNRFT